MSVIVNDRKELGRVLQGESTKPLVLVTGATGYVGARLVRLLLQKGYRVHCLVRTPRKLKSRTWRDEPNVEVVQVDLLEPDGLVEWIRGCESAYYFVHAMVSAGEDFAKRDRAMARSFACACEQAGVKRIIYLGGLGEMGQNLRHTSVRVGRSNRLSLQRGFSLPLHHIVSSGMLNGIKRSTESNVSNTSKDLLSHANDAEAKSQHQG